MLSDNTTLYFAYLAAIIGPPVLAAMLYTQGFKGNGRSTISIVVAGFLLLIWMPMILIAPIMLKMYFFN